MAILFGTTSTGATLPVLVDQFGNLLAQGMPGEQGPPGPPGIGELPPNPFDGAILGWENGELVWVDNTPILPAGVFGPYTYVASDGRLDIPQDASSLVNGQLLYMSDATGAQLTVNYATDTIANVNGNVLTFPTSNNFDKFEVGNVVQGPNVIITAIDDTVPSITVDGGSWYGADGTGDAGDGRYEPSQEWSTGLSIPFGLASGTYEDQFDGNLTSFANPAYSDQSWTFISPTTIILTENIRLKPPFVESFNYTWSINGNSGVSATITDTSFYELQGTTGLTIGPGNPLVIGSSAPAVACKFTGMRVNNQLLVDSSIPGGRGETIISKTLSGSGSVLLGIDGSILLLANNSEWVDSYYVST